MGTIGTINNAVGSLVALKVTETSLKMISSTMKSSGKKSLKFEKIKW